MTLNDITLIFLVIGFFALGILYGSDPNFQKYFKK